MSARRLALAALIAVSGVALASCGSTPRSHPITSTTAAPVAQNLVANASVRAALLAAGAKSHGLVSADYVGLYPRSVFYAYDPNTGYWAGASLDPSPHSYAAQVSSQDDGSYLIFHRAAGASRWTVYQAGMAGFAGTPCPITIPSTVLELWNWTTNACRWSTG